MLRLRSSLLLMAVGAIVLLPHAHAQEVRDGAGNVIIRGDVAASRGMAPSKPFFTQSVDPSGNYVAPGGGGSGGGNAATTSNAADAQATSATNQQNVVFNYLFNGSTWDRLRGTGGAVNTLFPPAATTTTGVLEPPTAAAGKIARTSTALAANTSTTIAAANANRIALGLQCGSGGVSVDETGGTLTAAAVGNGTLFIPTGTGPYFTPPVATRTAITAYTATAQTCVVTEYLR